MAKKRDIILVIPFEMNQTPDDSIKVVCDECGRKCYLVRMMFKQLVSSKDLTLICLMCGREKYFEEWEAEMKKNPRYRY